jgi:hypothetical protein
VVRARVAVLLPALLGAVALTGCGASQQGIPANISDEQALELALSRYDYDLGLLLEEFPDVAPPELGLQMMVASRTEWSAFQVMCLVDEGIRGATPTRDGYAINGDNDPVDEAVARFTCRYRYPIDPRVLGALSPEQAGYAFDYLVERVVPCMRSLGFEPSPPPDRDDFIAYSERVWGAVLWSPYGRFWDKYSGPERTLVDRHCPPLPDEPFAVFNGTLNERLIGEE